MTSSTTRRAPSAPATFLLAALFTATLAIAPPTAAAFDDCPSGVACTQLTGGQFGKGFFRILLPDPIENWDGDLVLVNHGFDLNSKNINPHETCQIGGLPCESNSECPSSTTCNQISMLGVEGPILELGKAVAAHTYSQTGWSVFQSRKNLKDVVKFMKKNVAKPERVIVTGFSMGGAVTVDATQRMKIDGAVPLCPAAGGGLPTWDAATDFRMVYDFLCDGVAGGDFPSEPDLGRPETSDSGSDAIVMASRVNACMGIFGGATTEQQQRFDDFVDFTGFQGVGVEAAVTMGFVTLGLHDFVNDKKRLKGKRIGWNAEPDLDYEALDPVLGPVIDPAIQRLTAGKGRKKLSKNTLIDFTKGKGKKAAYPILSLAGTSDFVAIPEFQRLFAEATALGNKDFTQAWIGTPGHCTFTEEEITATFNEYFAWLDGGPQPTGADIEAACIALDTGVDGDTCNFDTGFSPNTLTTRIPARSDWFPAALVTD